VRMNFARWVWREESSPRPMKSVLYREVAESTMRREKRVSVII